MQTECYRNINELSLIHQDFEKILEAPITKGQKKVWNNFIQWLRNQIVETKWDFKAKWRWRITEDQSVVCIKSKGEEKTYKRLNDQSCGI